MATAISDFEKWLSEQLLKANADIDLDIFVPYITGILDEDTPYNEIKESLIELLSQVTEEDKDTLTESIIDRWKIEQQFSLPISPADVTESRLCDMVTHTQLADTTPQRNLTDEEKAAKAAILNQYAEIAGELDEDDAGGGEPADDTVGLARNNNAEAITLAEREKREKSKAESAAKKEKDKTDRAAQKDKQQDRKDTEKKRTQKGERKR